jgi:DNA-binding transcriptional LysR family regulator
MRVAANSSSKIVLQYLRYVLAAAEKHSFRQAAVELGVWESTISRGIRDLEHEMGVALFIRHPGGVTLTNAGTRFLNHALLAVGRIEYALKDAVQRGVVKSAQSGSGFSRLSPRDFLPICWKPIRLRTPWFISISLREVRRNMSQRFSITGWISPF